MRFRWGAMVSPAGIIAAACAGPLSTLPDIPRGVCGNQYVDTDTEYCDTFPRSLPNATSSVCNAPGTHEQCHFSCKAAVTEGGTVQPQCPSGQRCGSVDSVCRAAKGEYAPFTTSIATLADRVYTGDFDGDGFTDVVARSLSDLKIYYGGADGKFAQTFPIRTSNVYPAVAHLTDPIRADLVFAAANGVAVWQGYPDRTLFPTASAKHSLFNLHSLTLTIELLTPGVDSLLRVSDGAFPPPPAGSKFPNGPQIQIIGPEGAPPLVLLGATETPDNLAGKMQAGRFRLDRPPLSAPCEEAAFAFTGEDVVRVFGPCRGNQLNFAVVPMPDGSFPADPQYVPPVEVRLPPGFKVLSGLQVGDVDGDQRLDLMINCEDTTGQPAVAVAFGTGDGTFHSSPVGPAWPPAPGDNQSAPYAPALSEVLAVGQITADSAPDFVLPGGVLLQTESPLGDASASGDGGGGIHQTFFPSPHVAWTEAQIRDINRDGVNDVVAGSTTSIDVYLGSALPLLDHSGYAPAGTASHLVFGDFDGDSALDIAYRERVGAQEDAIAILFGNAVGPPEQPIQIARLPEILQVNAAKLGGQLFTAPQTVSTINVVARGLPAQGAAPPQEFAVFLQGSTDREIQAPFLLQPGGQQGAHNPVASPLAVTVGSFASAGSGLAALGLVSAAPTDPNADQDVRLYMVPAQGADLQQAAMVVGDPLAVFKLQNGDPLDWAHASISAVNIEGAGGGGRDGLIVLVPPSAGSSAPGRLFLQVVTSGAWTPLPGEDIRIGHDSSRSPPARWQLGTRDVNGDGAEDVIVLADGADAKGNPAITVFWGRPGGGSPPVDLANGSVIAWDGAGATTRDAAPSSAITGFATLIADASTRPQVFVLTDAGVFSAKTSGTSPKLFPLAPVPGLSAIVGGKTIAAADMNADGVDDVAILSANGLQLFQGLPSVPPSGPGIP